VVSPKQLANALASKGGVANVKVFLGGITHDVDYPTETVEMLDIGGTVSAKKGHFHCSTPLCSARYLSQRGLDKHEITGMCHFRKHQQTTQDEANSIFFSKYGIPEGLVPAARANTRYFKTHLET
jgi:hypothetical protein